MTRVPGLWRAVLAAPALVIGAAVFVLATPLPYQDDWDILDAGIAAWRDGTFRAGDLLVPHNEHPVAAARLLTLLVGIAAGGGIRVLPLVGFLEVVATFAGIVVLQRVTTAKGWRTAEGPEEIGEHAERDRLTLVLAAFTVFSAGSQHELWGWGFASVQWFFLNLAAIWMVVCLARWPTAWRGVLAACGCAALGSLTHAAGVVLWIVGGLMIAASAGGNMERARRVRHLAVWSLAAVAVVGTTVMNRSFQSDPSGPAGIGFAPLATLRFALTSLGLTWSGVRLPPAALGAIGALGVVAFVALVVLARGAGRAVREGSRLAGREAGLRPWFALGAVGLLVCLAIAVGRVRYGPGAALAGRYGMGGVLFWVSLWRLLAVVPPLASARRLRVLVAVVATLYVLGLAAGLAAMVRSSRNAHFALAELYTPGGPSRDVLRFLYPDERRIRELLPRFERLEVAPFSPDAAAEARNAALAMSPIRATERAEGRVARGDCDIALYGWAWDPLSPDRPVDVDVLEDGRVVGTTTAGWFEWHLVTARIGNGRHVFRFMLPDELKDGRPHVLSAVPRGAPAALAGSPVALTCSAGLPS